MKSLIATTILFVALLVCITINFFFIHSIVNHMEHLVEALPGIGTQACIDATQEIRDYWDQRTNLIGLSVGYNIIDRVCEQSAVLVACAEVQDLYGYHSAKALLLDALGDARRTEQFSIGNLF